MNLLAVIPLPYRLLAMAVAALALVAFGWFKGNEHGTQKLTNYIGEQAREAVRIGTARRAITEKVVTQYVKVAGETQIVTQTVEKEVIRYADANPGACLDPEWRRLHDRAALNTVSDTGRSVDVAPRAAEALETVTANYAACHRTADRLGALQDWVRAQAGVN